MNGKIKAMIEKTEDGIRTTQGLTRKALNDALEALKDAAGAEGQKQAQALTAAMFHLKRAELIARYQEAQA